MAGFFDELTGAAQNTGGFFQDLINGATSGLGHFVEGTGQTISNLGNAATQATAGIPVVGMGVRDLINPMVQGIGTLEQHIGQGEQGKNPYAGMSAPQTIGSVGSDVLNAALPLAPELKAGEALLGPGASSMLKGLVSGGVAGGTYGGAMGVAGGIQQPGATPGSVLASGATGAVAGGLFGGALGTAGGAIQKALFGQNALDGTLAKAIGAPEPKEISPETVQKTTAGATDPSLPFSDPATNVEHVQTPDEATLQAQMAATGKAQDAPAMGSFIPDQKGPASLHIINGVQDMNGLMGDLQQRGIPQDVMSPQGNALHIADPDSQYTGILKTAGKENMMEGQLSTIKGHSNIMSKDQYNEPQSNLSPAQGGESVQPNAVNAERGLPEQGAKVGDNVQTPVLPEAKPSQVGQNAERPKVLAQDISNLSPGELAEAQKLGLDPKELSRVKADSLASDRELTPEEIANIKHNLQSDTPRVQVTPMTEEERMFHEIAIGRPLEPHEEQALVESKLQSIDPKIEDDFERDPGKAPIEVDKTRTDRVPDKASEMNALKKKILSKGTVMKAQGEAGQEAYQLARGTIDRSELLQTEIHKQLPLTDAIMHGDKATRENFIKAVENKEPPMNIQVQQAVAEFRQVDANFRETGIKAGLNIGDLGPTHFPHDIDYKALLKSGNKAEYNAAINHLLDSGQAHSDVEAIDMLRSRAATQDGVKRFGNFESPRIADLPNYKTDAGVLDRYIAGGSKRIAESEAFGPNGEKIAQLVAKATKDGKDGAALNEAITKFMDPPTPGGKIGPVVRGAISLSKMGLTAINHATQTSLTAVQAGALRTTGGWLKLITSAEDRQFVKDSAVNVDVGTLRRQEMGVASKAIAPGLTNMMKANRGATALAGKMWADSLASKASAGDVKALNILRTKLGVTGDIAPEGLTRDQQIQAARNLVQSTMFHHTPLDTPMNAEMHPFVSQFRLAFGYKVTGFMYNQVLKEATAGNFAPLMRALVILPLAGEAVIQTKSAIKNVAMAGIDKVTGTTPAPAPTKPQSPVMAYLQALNQGGGFGLPGELASGLQYVTNSKGQVDPFNLARQVASSVAPAAGVGFDAAKAVASSVNNQSLQPLERFGLQQTPVVGTQLANALTPAQSAVPAQQALASLTGSTAGGGAASGVGISHSSKSSSSTMRSARRMGRSSHVSSGGKGGGLGKGAHSGGKGGKVASGKSRGGKRA